MPLDPTALAALLTAALAAPPPIASPADFSNRLATVIIAYLKANAVVVGVATGAMAGGPGVPVVGTLT